MEQKTDIFMGKQHFPDSSTHNDWQDFLWAKKVSTSTNLAVHLSWNSLTAFIDLGFSHTVVTLSTSITSRKPFLTTQYESVPLYHSPTIPWEQLSNHLENGIEIVWLFVSAFSVVRHCTLSIFLTLVSSTVLVQCKSLINVYWTK